MTVETLSPAMPGEPYKAPEPADRHLQVIVVGLGANTRHFLPALREVETVHPVDYFQQGEPQIPVDPDHLHYTDTPEGVATAEALFNVEGTHRCVYLSVVPKLHVTMIKQFLKKVGEGKLDRIIVAKPAVENLEQMREIDAAIAAAKEQLRARPGYQENPDEDFLYVHEHYPKKEAWSDFCEWIPTVVGRLGRPVSVAIDIQEKRKIEDEDRTAAVAGGAGEDLGPHGVSLWLRFADALSQTRYHTDTPRTSVQRYRYAGSKLQEGVETGLIVNGNANVVDAEHPGEAHNIDLTFRAGKGLADIKQVAVVFEHPDTRERQTVHIDLAANTLQVPDALRDILPKREYTDNGYGHVMVAGLNGGDPNASFQSWREARKVIFAMHRIERQGSKDCDGNERLPIEYNAGVSLQALSQLTISHAMQ